MAKQDHGGKSGNVTPDELADPTKHQEYQVFEEENRPPPFRPGTAGSQEKEGKTRDNAGEGIVGHVAARDPSGAVAPPAEANKPGASTHLDGTPSALTTSEGRQAD